MSHDYDDEEKPASSLTISKDNKLYHVFKFLQESYENDIGKFLTSFNSVLALGFVSDRINNKYLKLSLNVLKYGVPAFLHGSELYNNIQTYIRKVKSEQSPTYNKRLSRFGKLLGIKENPPQNLYENNTQIEYDLVAWLVQRPNTDIIKVLGLYSGDTGDELDVFNTPNNAKTNLNILLEYENNKYVLDTSVYFMYNSYLTEDSAIIAPYLMEDKAEEIRKTLTCEFIKSLNISKNTLYFNNLSNIKYKPRVKVEEDINQFDVPDFVKEIQQVLECERKRAYVFVSRPGTGKSTILRKIEEMMTDTVIFHLSPSDLSSSEKIKDRFSIIEKISKCIVIIEDLDSCDMYEKDSKTGVFLDAIDDVNNKLNMVILVTVNDTSRVHFSVINRPGRFDKVIEIKPPQKVKDVYDVMLSKANKLKKNYCKDTCFMIPPLSNKPSVTKKDKSLFIDQDLLKRCLKFDYTQAEIADAITEQIFIDSSIGVKEKLYTWEEAYVKFNDFFENAIESHETTRAALKSCNFHNMDPMGDLKNNNNKCDSGGPPSDIFKSYSHPIKE
jgi:hypothetical protein